jgi:hypothetical protein
MARSQSSAATCAKAISERVAPANSPARNRPDHARVAFDVRPIMRAPPERPLTESYRIAFLVGPRTTTSVPTGTRL